MHYRRIAIPGATYFFTVNLLNRKSDLLIKQINKLRDSFKKVLNSYPFEIDGVVILPDHFHIMMTLPAEDKNYSLRIRLIKGYFSQQIVAREFISPVRKKKNERGIWQRRFWEHLIRDEKDYEHHLNYMHYNPVKHGYVKRPSDWPYSSIHRAIRLGNLPENWAYTDARSEGLYGE
ncbi:Transposase and inactivated derivatives [Legionella donaldsonii]|uniref:Transposase and inactivated derivatives n=1 Tax=Legionella donaldsonii TaxID=45060 RepID=A0A378JAN4_9GAMM|nr:transposase [Legionella donaldsonii]STX44539.1 Transposase and inactivated derivatives [Legionella donaldsonii]